MNIAILLAELRFDSQQKMVSGILESAFQDASNVFLFLFDDGTKSIMGHGAGENQILSLVKFDAYDGVVLHGDSIRKREIVDELAMRIKNAGIPAVSFNRNQRGIPYVGLENFNGIYEIVNHLIKEHGARNINFVSGPQLSGDARERLEAYRCALEENGIPFQEERVCYGDWSSKSGEEAVHLFLDRDATLPDAFVAANDDMALGIFYALQEKGYNVPEHVRLTGYDNTTAGKYHYPRLTSVKRPELELGKESYKMLKSQFEGKKNLATKEFMCRPIFAESCGCPEKHTEDTKTLRRKYVKQKLHVATYADIVRYSAADFTSVETYEQLFEEIKRYALRMKLGEFYFCMCVEERFEEEEALFEAGTYTVRNEYTEKMYIPLLYRDGQFSSHGSFDRDELLPKEYTEGRTGTFYTITPLHYREYCYGYFVLCNDRVQIDSDIFHLFMININNALENIRQKRMMSRMINRLDRMWIHDPLTGVFNRAGFFKFASAVIDEAKRKKNVAFIIFLDLDGLKKINDQYGHDEGDKYIKAMADVLSKVRCHGELLMRYGGDEFVVLAQGKTEQDAGYYVDRIHEGIEEYNDNSAENFELQASIGYTILDTTKEIAIDKAIELADQEMYKIKKAKKGK